MIKKTRIKRLKNIMLMALLSFASYTNAQELFTLPSVICTNQRVDLESQIKNAASYNWHFCSASLSNTPNTSLMSSAIGQVNFPSHATMVKANGKYYSFYVNAATRELIRMDMGNNMTSTPGVANMGTLGNVMPEIPTAIDIAQDPNTGRWFGLIVGFNSLDFKGTITRLDFGNDIENSAPIGVNFGNYNTMDKPLDVNIAIEGSNIVAYTINSGTNTLGRIDLGSSIYNNPSVTNLSSTIIINPTAMVLFEMDGIKYGMVSNVRPSGITLLNYGSAWTNVPSVNPLGNFAGNIADPNDLTVAMDCGALYFYVNSSSSLNLTALRYTGNFQTMIPMNLGNVTQGTSPMSLTEVFRVNNRIHLIDFNESSAFLYTFDTCNASYDFQISTDQNPSYVKYYTPGIYTIYHVVNEGLPNEYVYCKTFEVIQSPSIAATMDSMICLGDSMRLSVLASGALAYEWQPDVNITHPLSSTDVTVWPLQTSYYSCFVTFDNGCIVDTNILVTVSQVKADAGPDRTLYDGSSVSIGGPGTSLNDSGSYVYEWIPGNEVKNPDQAFTFASPKSSNDFVLRVTNKYGCQASDTTRLWVNCDDIHLPNAFDPTSFNNDINTYKILNNNLYKLNYFRIFNRYGNLLFETTDISKGWDGIYEGVLQPQGNYVWVVEGLCKDGFLVHRNGTVMLIR